MKVEQQQQQQHFCNFCFKSFPSQPYLSSHITACPSTSSSCAASQSHPDDQQQQHHCKECGKRFQSMKALCGHMACHSDKLKVFNNTRFPDHSWDGNAAAAADDDDDHRSVMDSQSDNDTGLPTRQRRSKRLRYKHHHHNNVARAVHANNNNTNGSPSVSGIIDVQDQDQDGARCLMMLSRDHSGISWAGFSSHPADSSDNNSIVLEAAAAAAAALAGGGANGTGKSAGADEKKFLKSCDSFNSSSSGYFQNGYGDSDESDAWVATGSSRWEDDQNDDHDDDLVDYKKKRNKVSECFICYKVFDSPQALGGHIASHKKLGNNDINIASGSSGENSLDHPMLSPPPHYEMSSSSSKYAAAAATKKIKKVKEKKAAWGWKNGKKYECPVCYKVLKSGQALGGHKRIHNINLFSNTNPAAAAACNYSEDHRKNDYKTIIRSNAAMKHHPMSENTDRLIDLNFPPPPT